MHKRLIVLFVAVLSVLAFCLGNNTVAQAAGPGTTSYKYSVSYSVYNDAGQLKANCERWSNRKSNFVPCKSRDHYVSLHQSGNRFWLTSRSGVKIKFGLIQYGHGSEGAMNSMASFTWHGQTEPISYRSAVQPGGNKLKKFSLMGGFVNLLVPGMATVQG